MTDNRYILEPIGYIRSPLTDLGAAPRQGNEGAPEATIELTAAVAPGLSGVAVGDEVIVLTWLHQADRAVLAVHPRNDLTLPLTGVFATRSPDRPNAVGLHRVTVLEVDAHSLRIVPIEAIDGTPVIDIKPVLVDSGA